jgi:hypothetical protein
MTNQPLSAYFELHRRYYRSVNLERDLDKSDTVQGYVPTERSAEALRRILSAIEDPNVHRAWTLTGAYGTGKSAFVHYLAALCAPEGSRVAAEALAIAKQAFAADSPEIAAIQAIPEFGFLRAVATAQREPLSWTIIRALSRGVGLFWKQKKRKPRFWMDLNEWCFQAESGNCQITDQQVLKMLREVVQAAKTDVLLIIDELGKNLEFAAHHQGIQDLYLLQQIAELELEGDCQVHLLGILHQSFAGYSDRLSTAEQSEWTKIHGRFTDIVLTESPSQMTRLIGQAINRSHADPVLHSIHLQAESWFAAIRDVLSEYEISAKVLAEAYPLHPLTALVLPMLCVRYAQNDRSLFTFLTSDEPYAFTQFLNSATIQASHIPTLKLHQLYDYFVEAVTGLASRLNLQRWVEVQGLIQDAKDQSQDVLKVLKTIGILNLVTSTGKFRATPELIVLALCDSPTDQTGRKHWQKVIQSLKQKKLITHRQTQDELRIWQGSDFDVEAAIQAQIEQSRHPLVELLTAIYPLKPLVAQRHYTTTGNLRYFEQRYVDGGGDLTTLTCATRSSDGLIAYWLDTASPKLVPPFTTDGKPLVMIVAANLELLRTRGEEFQALKKIWQNAPELQSDGVAKREVRQRLVAAEQLLKVTVALAFDWSTKQNACWIAGEPADIESSRSFQAALSDLCDRIYHQGLVLDNELINRRELTSQGAKARRELIEAMLEHASQKRLGLEGYGPEVAMYGSVLEATGIHRQEGDEWGFYPPLPLIPASSVRGRLPSQQDRENGLTVKDVDVSFVWDAIAEFCRLASAGQRSLDLLYEQLERPPYGVKSGAIPILLAAYLLYHVDDVGIYKDGTFIPVLGPEHFELLVKDPSRFSVKYFEMVGLRSQVFRELETVLKSSQTKTVAGVRNASLLAIAKPLFGFVRQLPEFTRSTKRLSLEALKVLQALQTAQEPDELLFISLPEACGFNPMTTVEAENEQAAKAFRKKLVQCIHEIQNAYDNLLSDCQKHLHEAFGVHSKEAKLREDLRVRASYLVGQCIDPILKHFVSKAVDEDSPDKDWLEALVRIVADKHPKGWIDQDLSRFEIALSDLVRRFQNLESLRTEIRRQGKGFDALRITVTEPNGQEVHEVVWIDEEHEELFDRLVEDVLNTSALKNNPRLQKGFLAKLNEKLLSRKEVDSLNEVQPSKRKRGQTA